MGLSHLQLDFKLDFVKQRLAAEQEAIVVVYDKNLLEKPQLNHVIALNNELSKIAGINHINSLYTAPNINRYLAEGHWHNMLEDRAYDHNAIAALKQDIIENKSTLGKFINPQTDTMVFYLSYSEDKHGNIELSIQKNIQSLLEKNKNNFSRIFQIGNAERRYVQTRKSTLDLLVCIPAFFILINLLFGWLFRNLLLALIPLGISTYGIFCALGAMGWLGIPLNSLFIVAIILTLAITVASNAHMIHVYLESKHLNTSFSRGQHINILFKKTLLPLFLAALTALLGFLLDILSFVKLIQDLSYAFILCIVFSTAASIFILPLLLPLIKMKKRHDSKVFLAIKERIFKLHHWSIKHTKTIITLLLVMSAAGIISASKIKIESLPYALFKNSDSFIQDIYFTNQKISGTNFLRIDISAKEKNIFLQPKYLERILESESKILAIKNSAYVYSLCDVIATTHQLLLSNQEYYTIPKNQKILNLFYQALKSYDPHVSLINDNLNQISVYVNYNIYSSSILSTYKEQLANTLHETLKGTPLHFKIDDFWSKYASMVYNLLILQIISVFTIYIICFIIIGILFRSITAGLVSIIPNLVPISVVAIAQYVLNIPITIISVILYSLIVGLAIDETIHMFYTFQQHYKALRNKALAVEAALATQTTPVTIASLAIALASLALLSSQFLPVAQLGALTGIGIFSTWIADLMITPFLMKKIDLTKTL